LRQGIEADDRGESPRPKRLRLRRSPSQARASPRSPDSEAVAAVPNVDAGAALRPAARPAAAKAKVRVERVAPATPREEGTALDGFTEIRLDDF